jgi:hypothetical protein
MRILPLVIAAALAPLAAHAQPAKTEPCAPGKFVCNVQVVEDMMATPDGRWIVGTAMTAGAGGLYIIDPRTHTARAADITVEKPAAPFADCPGPPDMKAIRTHGLELKPGKGAVSTIYAVNHGGRESLEVFRIDASGTQPKVAWTGCLLMPTNASGNAVASLPDGRIALTKFMNANDADGIVHIMSGQITGTVYLWTPGQGFKELPGTQLSGDNGLVVAKDGKSLFVTDFGNKAVYRVALDGSGQTGKVSTDFRPDNLRWAPDGKIIATGQFVDLSNRNGPHGWAAIKIDPATLAVSPYVKQAGTAAFDNGTTTLVVGKELYVGTYRGDRVAVLAAP